MLRTHKAAWRSRPSAALLWSTAAIASVTLTIPFLGGVSAVFGFVPLTAPEMIAVIVIVLGYSGCTEAAKAHFFAATRAPRRSRPAGMQRR